MNSKERVLSAFEHRKPDRVPLWFDAPNSGYCLAASHDLMLDEFPVENVIAMYNEAFGYGVITR